MNNIQQIYTAPHVAYGTHAYQMGTTVNNMRTSNEREYNDVASEFESNRAEFPTLEQVKRSESSTEKHDERKYTHAVDECCQNESSAARTLASLDAEMLTNMIEKMGGSGVYSGPGRVVNFVV